MSVGNVVLIGEDRFLTGLGDAVIARGGTVTAVVSRVLRVRDWAQAAGVPVLPSLDALPDGPRPDWVIGVGMQRTDGTTMLALPRLGAVSYHDGPLPHYAGVNTQVWALLAGETRHGVTWLLPDTDQNLGDVVLRQDFEIAADETAASLIAKCQAAGLESFDTLLDRMEAGALEGEPQDRARRRYFRHAARPLGDGRLDFTQGRDELLRLVRALDFGGARNPMASAKIEVAGKVVLIGAAAAAEGQGSEAPGTVLSADPETLVVATGSGAVALSGLTDPMRRPLAADGLARPGDRLSSLDPTQAARLRHQAVAMAPSQWHWRSRLSTFRPAVPGFVRQSGEAAAWADHRLPAPQGLSDEALFAALAAWVLASCDDWSGGLAFAGRDVIAAAETMPGYVNPWVPLGLGGDAAGKRTLAELAEDLEPDFAAARAGGFAADIIARHPGLAPFETPALGLSAGGPIQGTALTLSALRGVVTLWHDTNALDVGAHCRLAGSLGRFLEALDGEGTTDRPVGALLAEAEAAPRLSVAAWAGLWAEDIPGAGPRPFAAPAFDRSAIMLRRREMRAGHAQAAE
ncbi:MAG: hypothetical protein KDK10_03680 [Maritimibacter sp.]|nr:hypothetical protein [Maritimibacter sp.]